MYKIKRLTWLALVCALLPLSAAAEVTFNTLNDVEDGGPCFGASGAGWVAVGFSVPAGSDWQLDSIRVRLHDVSEAPGTPFSASLYSDNAGEVGTELAEIGTGNGTYGVDETFDVYELTPAAAIDMNAGTAYWVVLTSSDPNNCAFGWSAEGADPAGSIFTYTGERQFFAGTTLNITDDRRQQLEVNATPDNGQAGFKVTKTFSDGNDAEVDVKLSCNGGLPLEQTFTIAGGDPDGVTFVLTNIPEAGVDCEVTETGGPAGYTSSGGCEWTDVTGGYFTCEITNEADDATYTVVKDWVQERDGGDVINAVAEVTIQCNAMIDGCLGNGYYPTGAGGNALQNGEPICPDVWYDEGYWYKSGDLEDGDTLEASVDVTQGPATCSASEEIVQSGVESVADGCGETSLGAGESHTCTFTNTVFFEGIPTLSQYGLALLTLLMLGVGFIGMRRFV